MSVKHGDIIPVVGGPRCGETRKVERFMPECFGEGSPTMLWAVDGVLYAVDEQAAVWRVVGGRRSMARKKKPEGAP